MINNLSRSNIFCVINQGVSFFVIYHKPFCYYSARIYECFVINCGKYAVLTVIC